MWRRTSCDNAVNTDSRSSSVGGRDVASSECLADKRRQLLASALSVRKPTPQRRDKPSQPATRSTDPGARPRRQGCPRSADDSRSATSPRCRRSSRSRRSFAPCQPGAAPRLLAFCQCGQLRRRGRAVGPRRAAQRCFAAALRLPTSRGSHSFAEPNDAAEGSRMGVVNRSAPPGEDVAGHRWSFTQSVADIAPEDWGATLPS
jgi:hypothetical protein